MLTQLEKLRARYLELGTLLSDPAIMADQRQYQQCAKEHAGLKATMEAYEQYEQAAAALAANRELAQTESDPALQALIQEEQAELEPRVGALEQELRTLLLPKDPNDERNVLLEIRAGTGGEEAALFAADLFRMYCRYAEQRRWQVEVMDSNPTGLGGIKEVIALLHGQGAYSALKYESGVHRVQRVPHTEASGRIHTSAATVAVLPEAEDIDVQINESELRVDVFRASGPGGQGVNTTDSAVRITHIPSGMVVVCREERSQLKNKARALKLLRTRLLEQQQQAQEAAMRAERRQQVKTGDRSEKIRTYNFPQNRVTDHRTGLTLHQLDTILEGGLAPLLNGVRDYFQAEALRGGS
ncbi:MAG: peptide chain release factor 1 [Deltaproteobacteria bacterium]|nr:peptide chain release factor 1 [Deltaproteobacteria bacterium]